MTAPIPHSQPELPYLRRVDAIRLLPMDIACLNYLAEHGDEGSAPTIAIPSRIFSGEIPAGHPNLVDRGLIKHVADRTMITPAGRLALSQQDSQP